MVINLVQKNVTQMEFNLSCGGKRYLIFGEKWTHPYNQLLDFFLNLTI